MASRCVVPRYAEDVAKEKKLLAQRYVRLRCRVAYCEDCDGYHVVYHDDYALLDERHRTILEKVASGLRDVEIAKDLGITPKQVEHAVTRLCRRLNAMTRANLVAIAVALAIINPTPFIPDVKKEQ